MPTTLPPYDVKRIETEDIHLLIPFYHKYFPKNKVLNDHKLWSWKFLKNPYVQSDIPFFIIRQSDKVMGGVGSVKSELQVAGVCVDASHASNLFVADQYKGLAAARLWRTNHHDHDTFFESYVSPDGARICKAGGFVCLSKYLKSYHYGFCSVDDKKLSSQYMKSLVTAAFRRTVNMFVRALFKIFRRKNTNEHFVQNNLTKEIVPKFVEGEFSNRIGILKSYDYLHWRYETSPALNCQYIVQTKDNVANCLIIVHRDVERNEAVILDIIRASRNELDVSAALLECARIVSEQGARIMSTTLLSFDLHKILRRLGFAFETSDNRFLVHSKDKEILAKISKAELWDFHLGDTDVY